MSENLRDETVRVLKVRRTGCGLLGFERGEYCRGQRAWHEGSAQFGWLELEGNKNYDGLKYVLQLIISKSAQNKI